MGFFEDVIYSKFESLTVVKKALFQYAHGFFIQIIITEDSQKSFLDPGVNYVKFFERGKNAFLFILINKNFKINMYRLTMLTIK